jgi:predicted DNA-binding protein
MESDKTVKRSIRIPLDLHQKLEWKSELLGKTVNQVILEDLGRLNGVYVGDRRRGRRWK